MENSILRTYTWDVVSILVVSFYVCFFFVNTTLVEIKYIGIRQRFYPKHYIRPNRWMRKLYSLHNSMIPKYAYVQLIVGPCFAVYGVVSVIAMIGSRFNSQVTAALIRVELLSLAFFAAMDLVMLLIYMRKEH